MKRVLLATGVAGTLAAAWAFYPLHAHADQANTGGYLLVTSRYTAAGFTSKGALTTIMPDGQVQTQELETKAGTPSGYSSSLDLLHLNETKKLNELHQAGWRVKTATQLVAGTVSETTYLLEKD